METLGGTRQRVWPIFGLKINTLCILGGSRDLSHIFLGLFYLIRKAVFGYFKILYFGGVENCDAR